MTPDDPRFILCHLADRKAAEVMTADPVVVTEYESVASAWELLARGGFHHLPVVRGGRCVGMLDDRCLVGSWTPGTVGRSRRTVGELLRRHMPSVGPDAGLLEVARRLREEAVDALPVVDDDGFLLGLITVTDLVHALSELDELARAHCSTA